MKLTDNNNDQANDILVMFPAAKNFPVENRDSVPSPLNKLIEEFEEQLEIENTKKPVMAIPAKESIKEIRGKSSGTTALEIRLKALEEIEQRLKFYLEDIGSAKRKI